jgi:GNAT superfamily N-acetyltransferase
MAPAHVVRHADPRDLAAVTQLLVAQLREHDIPVRREHVARRVEAAVAGAEGHVVLVAASARALPVGVAYVSFAEPLEHDGTVAWLEELYVVPELRDGGIGGRLVAGVIEEAERRGCVAVELETKRGHERAGHLYVRHGFRDLERTHYARALKAWDW